MPSYTQGHSKAMMASHQSRSAADSCSYFTPLLETRPAARILDVGCGPGTITADLARHFIPQGEIVGIDYSENAIKNASEQESLPSNVKFHVVNFDNGIPFPDNSFDVVHTHQVLLHLSEPVKALKEMRRVCKPGGFIASREGDFGMFATFPELPALKRYVDVHMRSVRASGAEPNGGRHLRYWALQAGFTDDNITSTGSPIVYAGPEKAPWWAAVQAERFGGGEFKERVVSNGWATEEEVTSFGNAWLEWGEQPGAIFMAGCGEIVAWK